MNYILLFSKKNTHWIKVFSWSLYYKVKNKDKFTKNICTPPPKTTDTHALPSAKKGQQGQQKVPILKYSQQGFAPLEVITLRVKLGSICQIFVVIVRQCFCWNLKITEPLFAILICVLADSRFLFKIVTEKNY